MFTKEFSVSTAPEVGRIIGLQNLPSTPIFHKTVIEVSKPQKTKGRPVGSAFFSLLLTS
ncbi:hypothetical protein EMIT0194P_30525 [Pseudomonas serbica]